MREETEESKKVRTPLAHLLFSQWLTGVRPCLCVVLGVGALQVARIGGRKYLAVFRRRCEEEVAAGTGGALLDALF